VSDVRHLVLRIETKTASLHRLHDLLAPKMLALLGRLEQHHEITLVPPRKKFLRKRRKQSLDTSVDHL
jgi:hypothetical protein